jgi:hypothetical protein
MVKFANLNDPETVARGELSLRGANKNYTAALDSGQPQKYRALAPEIQVR